LKVKKSKVKKEGKKPHGCDCIEEENTNSVESVASQKPRRMKPKVTKARSPRYTPAKQSEVSENDNEKETQVKPDNLILF